MNILAIIALVGVILSLVLYPDYAIVFGIGCIVGVCFSAFFNKKL